MIFNAIFPHILFSEIKIYRIVVFSDRTSLQLCTEIVFQQRFLKYLAITIANLFFFFNQVPVLVKRPVLFVEEDKTRGCELGVEERSNIVLHLMCGRAKLQPIQIAFARQQEKLQI